MDDLIAAVLEVDRGRRYSKRTWLISIPITRPVHGVWAEISLDQLPLLGYGFGQGVDGGGEAGCELIGQGAWPDGEGGRCSFVSL